MNMKQRTIRRLKQMIIIDAGVEREATAEEEAYIKKMHFYDEMMEKKMELSSLEKQLSDGDYKIIKSYECSLINIKIPYDMEQLHSERQNIRDRINSLREEITDYESKWEEMERKEANDSN